MSSQPTVWADRLLSSAKLTLGEDPLAGTREALTGSVGSLRMARLVSNVLGVQTQLGFTPESTDERLWASLAGLAELPDSPTTDVGPITGEPSGPAIEVWTEVELASVHAAWSLGGNWRESAARSAAWLVEHVQPDNATNRPWAVHVFAQLAESTGDPSYELYAQTLLHNCQVTSGRPDPFSAMILLHAAGELQAC